jgi:hypothetical protein
MAAFEQEFSSRNYACSTWQAYLTKFTQLLYVLKAYLTVKKRKKTEKLSYRLQFTKTVHQT